MKKEFRQKLAFAQTEALRDLDSGAKIQDVWRAFKLATHVITDAEFRATVNGTDGLIEDGRINTTRRLRRWIEDWQKPEEVE